MKQLRAAICGSGNRSRTVWQRQLKAASGIELVGVQDIAQASLDQAVQMGNIAPGRVFLDLGVMLADLKPDILLVACVSAAHAEAIDAGLEAGCHVLTEKPFTTDLAAAARLVNKAQRRRRHLAVVQNWRTKSVGQAARAAVSGGMVGAVSHIFFRYIRDRELPHLPGYLFDEPDPLLLAVSIHHLDLFRYVLGQEIATIEGRCRRPHWSRYRGPSVVQLWIETDAAVVISYVATFSSRNASLPIESLQIEGELGTLLNDSDYSEPPLYFSRRGAPAAVDLTADVTVRDSAGQYQIGDRAILDNFIEVVRGRSDAPIAPACDNLGTLAAVEAARLACRQRGPVDPRQLLAKALAG